MSNPGFFALLLAREPRKLARFPDLPLDAALAEYRALEAGLSGAPPSANSSSPLAGTSSGTNPARAHTASPLPAVSSTIPTPAAAQAAAVDPSEALGSSLCALTTQVWRTKAKMIDQATGEPKEEMRRVYRHVEGALENLAQMGVTMNDWINQPYDPGLPVKVLTFQPTPGVHRDTVVEAVRPTVIWNDKILQLGEVVVGIPPNQETTPQ